MKTKLLVTFALYLSCFTSITSADTIPKSLHREYPNQWTATMAKNNALYYVNQVFRLNEEYVHKSLEDHSQTSILYDEYNPKILHSLDQAKIELDGYESFINERLSIKNANRYTDTLKAMIGKQILSRTRARLETIDTKLSTEQLGKKHMQLGTILIGVCDQAIGSDKLCAKLVEQFNFYGQKNLNDIIAYREQQNNNSAK